MRFYNVLEISVLYIVYLSRILKPIQSYTEPISVVY